MKKLLMLNFVMLETARLLVGMGFDHADSSEDLVPVHQINEIIKISRTD